MSSAQTQLARWLSMAEVTAKKSIRKDVHARAKSGQCLQCGKHENNRRGLCNACYLKFNRAKLEEPLSERMKFDQERVFEGRVLAVGELKEIKNPNPFKVA